MLSEFNSDEKNQRECSGSHVCLCSVERRSRGPRVRASSSGWELLLGHALSCDLADLTASLVPLPAYQEGQKDQRYGRVWGFVKPLTSITLTSRGFWTVSRQAERALVMSHVCSQGACAEAPFKSPEREVYGGRGERKRKTIEHGEKQQASREGSKKAMMKEKMRKRWRKD